MLSFNKLIMLTPTKTEEREMRWQQWQIHNCPGQLFVIPSCLCLLQAISHFSFFFLVQVLPSFPLILNSRFCSVEDFWDKSTEGCGVLRKPKARRRSTGLLRRAVVILVTCYRRACSSVYLQLLLPLGAHLNAWGWLLCNEFRNPGSQYN